MKRVPEVAAMAVLVAGTGLLSLHLWGRAHSGFWAGPALIVA